ncbi:2461_t:CDS:2, partial [Racocetra fulgida]
MLIFALYPLVMFSQDLYKNAFDISQNNETVENQNEEISFQNKSVNKGGHPRSDIWNYFTCGTSDDKGHYNANCRPSVLESYLALHCKGNVPNEIRQHWLVQVAKQNDNIKDPDHSDDESVSPSSKPFEPIHSYYISNLKNELKFYGKELSESELRESALNQTTYAEIENTNILEQNEDVLMSFQLSNHEKLKIESVVNLSHTHFGDQDDNEEEPSTTIDIQGSGNMDFDSAAIVE